MDRSKKTWICGALLLGVVVFWWISSTKNEPTLIGTVLPERPKDSLPEAAIAKRFRHVEINSQAVKAVSKGEQTISLSLFPGETVRVRLDKAEQTDPVSTEVHGEVIGMPGAAVSFVTYDGTLAGSITYPDGRMFLINYADKQAHSIVEIGAKKGHSPHGSSFHPETFTLMRSSDQSVTAMPQYRPGVRYRVPGFPGFTHVLNLTNRWPTNRWPVPRPPVYGPPIVGVLVCYTSLAEKQCGGVRGIETRARISIAQTNNSFRRSAIIAKLVLLGTKKVSYTTSGNSTVDLVNMTFARTPQLYDVHKQRKIYRADLVSLFTGASPKNIMHGSSWMLNTTNGAPAYGFNAMEAVYAPTSVFVHEIGHNLGCSHATNDVGGFMHGSFTNSHGWRFGITTNGNTYPMRTMMAYGRGRRLGNFSNPNVSVWGVPTGDTNYANNAFTISQMAPKVGSYFTQIIHGRGARPYAFRYGFPWATNRPGVRRPRRVSSGRGGSGSTGE